MLHLGFVGIPTNREDAYYVLISVLMALASPRLPLGLFRIVVIYREYRISVQTVTYAMARALGAGHG